MTTYNTGNPIGSSAVKDLYDNAENLDVFVNSKTATTHPDRLGVGRKTWNGIEQEAQAVLSDAEAIRDEIELVKVSAELIRDGIGFLVPVDYTPGLDVGTTNFTVKYDGVVYAAQPGKVPFVSGAWDNSQWYPLQNTLSNRAILSFHDLASAEAAAATLPDGQVVVSDADEVKGVVVGGSFTQEQSIYKVADYAKIRSYIGRGTRLRVVDPTGAHWWVRRGAAQDNGGTVLVDAQGRSWEREYSGAVNLRWFGAAGNGTGDDRAALNAALALSNVVLDGGSGTYKVGGELNPITGSNIKLRDLTIDSSASSSVSPILNFTGVRGAFISITANVLAGDSTLTLASTSELVAGQYVYIGSNTYYSAGQTSRIGQIVRINTVDSATQVTLYSPTLYAFSAGAAAYVQPLTVATGIELERVNMVGNPTAAVLQEAVRASTCDGFTATDCTFRNYNYASIRLDRSVGSRIRSCKFLDAAGAGLSYGVAVTFGCTDTVVVGCRGENLRHLVSTGGSLGVNTFTRALYNYATSMWDAGLDCHCNSDFTDYSHNHIEMSSAVAKEGVIVQGGSVNIVGNTIVGCKVHAIRYESLTDGQEVAINISNNIVDVPTNHAIYVYTAVGYTTNITSLTISGNNLKGAGVQQHITVYAQGGSIFNVSIFGNVCEFQSSERCIYIRALNGAKVDRIAVTGNVAKADSDSSVCWMIGDSTSQINDVVISGNTFSGGDYSVYFNYVNRASVSANHCVGFAVGKYRVTETSTAVDLDRGTIPVRTYSTGGSYVVQADDRHLIINRAATVAVTLPPASTSPGRELFIKTVQAHAVNSASADVAPISSTVAGTVILPATAGAWALLVSDGAGWVVMQKG